MELKRSAISLVSLALLFIGANGLCMPEHPQRATCRSKFVLRGKILSIDWEKDRTTTAAPTTTTTKPTTKPFPTLPKPEDGETDFLIGRKPDPSLIGIFKKGVAVEVTGTDFLAEPAMLPFFRPRYIRVELQKLIKGIRYLPRDKGHQFNIKFTSMHRVPYEVGQSYLLTGFAIQKELAMNDCNWFSEWDKISDVMHRGLKRYYWRYCGCQVKNCFGNKCKVTARQCSWDIPFSQVGFQKADFLSRNRVCMVICGRRCDWFDPRKKMVC